MTTRLRSLVLLFLALGLVPAAVAQAAPARTITFAAAGKQSWDTSGSGIIGFSDGTIPVDSCTAGARECDDTLVKLDVPGTLTVTGNATSSSMVDYALDIFESDASGTVGKNVKHADGSTPNATETVGGEFDPGFYIVRVDFLLGQGGVKMDADLVAATVETPPATTPPAAANAKPTAVIKLAKKIKASKLKSIGGTASDDGKVAKVEVGLLQVKGSKCKQLTSTSAKFRTAKCSGPTKYLKATGSSSWALKLKKKLPKGKYIAFAKATDDKGETQAAPTKVTFTVS